MLVMVVIFYQKWWLLETSLCAVLRSVCFCNLCAVKVCGVVFPIFRLFIGGFGVAEGQWTYGRTGILFSCVSKNIKE